MSIEGYVGHVTKSEIRNELNKKRLPGPTSYEPKEDIAHPSLPAYTIPQAEKPNTETIDKRPPLNVNDALVKKRIPEVFIAPEEGVDAKLGEIRRKIEDAKVGPGKYDLNFKQVEKRTDTGYVEMIETKEPSEHNEQRFLTFLNPNYDYDKPGKLVFQYKEPSNVHPKHVTDAELYPEHWKFYDVQKKQHEPNYTFSNNLDYHKYQLAEEQNAIRNALKILQQRMPEVGQYEPQLPRGHEGIDFSKGVSRDPYYTGEALLGNIIARNDSLVLEPDKPRGHIPGVQMDKLVISYIITNRKDEKTTNYQKRSYKRKMKWLFILTSVLSNLKIKHSSTFANK